MSVRLSSAVGVLLVVLLPGVAAAQQPAGLDAEASTPYLWRVVIQTRPHPLLTPAFRDQLRRDLLAALQPGVGTLATVDVIDLDSVPRDKWDTLWQQFDDKGFAALDAPRDLTGVKTHFLRIEFRDGAFHLEARQHDGFTGIASPVTRKQSTRAAELVGRTAGLLIDRDFGLAGTIEPAAGKDEVQVRFKAGQLGPLDRFVTAGDVFAVSRISRTNRPAPEPARTATGKIIAPPPGSTPPPAYTPELREFTVLRVLDVKEGVARCSILTRTPLTAGGRVVGYRCLRLPTVSAPVSIRLVSGDGTTPSVAVANVWATDSGFTDRPAPRDFLDLRDGVYRSNRPLANVACVTVSVGPTLNKPFVVPILGPDPVTIRFEVDPKAEEKAAFERAVLALASRSADARVAQVACFDAVGKLIKDRKNPEALARAKAGFQAADTADKVLGEEVAQLKAQAEKSPAAAKLLDNVAQQLGSLRAANGQLAARIKDLEAVVAKATDKVEVAREVQAQAVNSRITLLLSNGEVEEALAAFDQLVTLVPEQAAEIKARKDKLAAEWKPKDDEHAKARQYLLATWPALTTALDLKDSLATLRTAVETCKKHGDKYAFRKLLTVLGGFEVKLTELTRDLDPNADADRKVQEDVKVVREVVSKIESELIEYLKTNP